MHSIPNLPDSITRTIYADLCSLLPPPPDDTQEARALRDERAMIAVAHLLPETAAEAELAGLIVAAQFRAREALRAASQKPDPDHMRRCTAQAACMMRQADSGIRVLLRLQGERVKAATALRPAAMERAGYWFYSDMSMINDLTGHNRYVPGSVHGDESKRGTNRAAARVKISTLGRAGQGTSFRGLPIIKTAPTRSEPLPPPTIDTEICYSLGAGCHPNVGRALDGIILGTGEVVSLSHWAKMIG